MKPANLKKQFSSGGVIFKKEGDVIEVALISLKGNSVWCLPKGLIDKSETPEITAVREVREETGLTGRIVDTLGDITYWYYIQDENAKYRKTVSFFLMEYVSGSTEQHDLEVDSAEWFSLDTALEKISYKGDRAILIKARNKLLKIKTAE